MNKVMNEGWFSKPVQVAVGISGDVRYVSNARQAVDLLTTHWPDAGTPTHRDARHACQAVLHGTMSADAAREAFVAAARRARILVD
jgi:hypothetical protein